MKAIPTFGVIPYWGYNQHLSPNPRPEPASQLADAIIQHRRSSPYGSRTANVSPHRPIKELLYFKTSSPMSMIEELEKVLS